MECARDGGRGSWFSPWLGLLGEKKLAVDVTKGLKALEIEGIRLRWVDMDPCGELTFIAEELVDLMELCLEMMDPLLRGPLALVVVDPSPAAAVARAVLSESALVTGLLPPKIELLLSGGAADDPGYSPRSVELDWKDVTEGGRTSSDVGWGALDEALVRPPNWNEDMIEDTLGKALTDELWRWPGFLLTPGPRGSTAGTDFGTVGAAVGSACSAACCCWAFWKA